MIEYIQKREISSQCGQEKRICEETAACHVPALLRERELSVGDSCDKVFAATWLDQVNLVLGTKDNKLLLLDSLKDRSWEIPLPRRSYAVSGNEAGGIHSITTNYSKTLLATGAHNSNDTAIFSIPSFRPVRLLKKHDDWIFASSWLTDTMLVTGSRDSTVKLWSVTNSDKFTNENPVVDRKDHKKKVRDVKYCSISERLVTLSQDETCKIWDPHVMEVVSTVPLHYKKDLVCLSLDYPLIAVGSRKYITFVDMRCGHVTRHVESLDNGLGVRSLSIRGALVTCGGGGGRISFFDLRVLKYLVFCVGEDEEELLYLSTGKGILNASENDMRGLSRQHLRNAVYAHSYDASGTCLLTVGGPIAYGLKVFALKGDKVIVLVGLYMGDALTETRSSSSCATISCEEHSSRGSQDSSSCNNSSLCSPSPSPIIFLHEGKDKLPVYSCINTLKHEASIYSLALSKFDNKTLLFTGSGNSIITGWQLSVDLTGLERTYKFGKGNGLVKALLSSGNKLFSAHQDNKIRIWKRRKFQEHLQSPLLQHKLWTTLPTPKDRLTKFMFIWNYARVRRHQKCLWIQHNDSVSGLTLDDDVMYSSSWDRTIKVWRLSDMKCLESFVAHYDAINAVAAAKSGMDGATFLYTGSADSTIKVWMRNNTKKSSHKLVSTLQNNDHAKSAVNALVLGENGGVLYSGMSDSNIIAWERRQEQENVDNEHVMKMLGILKGHKKAVLCLAIVATRKILCSGSADKSVRIWQKNDCCVVLEGHSGPVKSLTVSDCDEEYKFHVYSGGLDNEVKVWEVRF